MAFALDTRVKILFFRNIFMGISSLDRNIMKVGGDRGLSHITRGENRIQIGRDAA